MESELRAAVAALQENATLYAEQQKKLGDADALVKEADARINARITELEDQLRDAVKAMRTPHAGRDEQRDQLDGAMQRYLRGGDGRLTAEDRAAIAQYQKALSVESDPDGGYLVSPTMSNRIMTKVYETSPIRQVAAVQTITSDALEGPVDEDEAGAAWVSETGARAETTTPQVGLWRIPVHEMYAMPKATQKLLEDAGVNVEGWLADKVSGKFARLQNTAFVNGTGVGQPRGFLTYPHGTTGARGTIEQVNTGAADAFIPESIITVIYSLKSAYRAGAVWAMNRSTVAAIRKLRDASGGAGTGQFFWAPGFGGQPATLGGYPILEAEDMPDVAANALAAVFGNFGAAYTIVDRRGITTLRDPYSSKPFVLFYTTARVGGDVVNFEALKVVKVAS